MSAAKLRDARLLKLQGELARECAESDIRGYGYGHMVRGVQWYEQDAEIAKRRDAISRNMRRAWKRAILYLDSIGALEHHTTKPWVRLEE